jgi:pyruvate/2-oxoglutarate/acetoin dehydrogenase E1 component
MIKANNFIKENKYSIDAELIDLRSLRPIDKKTILKSVKKTKKVLIIDNGMITCGISAEILSIISENLNEKIVCKRIGVKDIPIPSSRYLADGLYPEYKIIIQEILKIFNIKINIKFKEKFSDIPDKNFKGPF